MVKWNLANKNKALLPMGSRVVSKIRQLGNFPIIACGGVSTKEDILSYKKVGANFFGIGSSLFKMDFAEIKNYFKTLNRDLKKEGSLAEKFLHNKIKECPDFILSCRSKGKVEKKLRLKNFLSKEKIYFSLNFLTKCEVGFCGLCAIKKIKIPHEVHF